MGSTVPWVSLDDQVLLSSSISIKWLLGFAVQCYDAAPEHLNVQLPQCPENVLIRRLEAEADELCSFVGKKADKQ